MEDIQVIEHIKQLCKERNWTYYKLAKESGIPFSSLNTMLNKQHIPSMKNLIKICKGFNITLSQFFSEIETENDEVTQLIHIWEQLDKEHKEIIISYIYGVIGKDINDLNNFIK